LNERFTFANQRFCQTLGKPLHEILGKTDFDFFPPGLAAKYQQDDRVIIETGKMMETIEENQPPSGEKLFVNVVKTPLYDSKGNIIGLQGIFWDITERRRDEERLRTTMELAKNRRTQAKTKLRGPRIKPRNSAGHHPSAISQFPSCRDPVRVGSTLSSLLPTGAVGGDFHVVALSDPRLGCSSVM
jgi:PAS domain S-box-containing protein